MKKIISFLLIMSIYCSNTCYASASRYNNLPRSMYNTSLMKIEEGRMSQAIDTINNIQKQFPFSEYSIKSQILKAFVLFNTQEYNNARKILDNFIMSYHLNESIEYAYYLRILCYEKQLSTSNQDAYRIRQLYHLINDMMGIFPNNKYKKDLIDIIANLDSYVMQQKLQNGISMQEMGYYVAAMRDFNAVIRHNIQHKYVKQALYRAIKTLLVLELKNEAIAYAVVLAHNFPKSDAHIKTYNLLASKHLIR